MSKTIIQTENAPSAVGPYSQAVVANGFVYTAGQLGLLPETMKMVEGGVQEQAQQALINLQQVLTAAGSSLDQVVKTTVFLANMDDFAAMNAIYATFFTQNPPARSAVEVARLPLGALVEIEAVALLAE